MPYPLTSAAPLKSCFAGFLQIDVLTGDIEANLNQVSNALNYLKPDCPGIIVLPELWATGFDYHNLPTLAERTPALLAALQDLASRYRIYLAGSLPEAAPGDDGPVFYNTLFVTGPAGTLGRYRKQQLFAPMREDCHLQAGDNPRPVETPLGKLAALVCYDLRFPELARGQTAQGAGILLVAAQWPMSRKDHWRTLLRARAIENQIFVVAANRCGKTADTVFAGHSMIIAPDGAILKEAGEKQEWDGTRLDPAQLDAVRTRFNTAAPAPYRYHDHDKIITPQKATKITGQWKTMGKKVVFTNGCFDILHAGHVTYLEMARKAGDCLIVGLNSDTSVRSIKGPKRPLTSQDDRARVLAALRCIDYVVLFDEDTPYRLICSLLPDVLAKGADWPADQIVGAEEVKNNGGRVVRIPLVDGASTTTIIERIREDKK